MRAIMWAAAFVVALFASEVSAQSYTEVECNGCSDTQKNNALMAACNAWQASLGPTNGYGVAWCFSTQAAGEWNGGVHCEYPSSIPPVGEIWGYRSYDNECPHAPISPGAFFRILDPCLSTQGQPITGTVARTGEPSASNPPPQEVCYEQCLYGLSSATAATGLDGSELWKGTWIGTGQACPGSSPPPTPGTGENGETSEGAQVGDATKAADDARAAYDSLVDGLKNDSLAQRSNPSDDSPIGSFWRLPSWVTGLLERQSTDCDLNISLPSSGALGMVSSAVASADVCGMQSLADTYGNWFVWFCAVIWSWAIVMGRGDE